MELTLIQRAVELTAQCKSVESDWRQPPEANVPLSI